MKKNYAPLSNLVDLMLDAVCVVDTGGRFAFASAACERIFGYTPEEMVGRLMIDMVLPEDRERTLAVAKEVSSGNAKSYFENRYVRKDGKVVHIMWSARWSELDQLRIGVARDITERKQAETLQAALYSISEAAHAAEDLLTLFQRSHQIVGELLPALSFSITLRDENTGELSFAYHMDELDQPTTPNSVAQILSTEVVRTGQSRCLNSETTDAISALLNNVVETDLLCWLGVPLLAQRGTIGALVIRSEAGSLRDTQKDLELLQFISTQLAAAIDRKQMEARLQHMAQNDLLTGLPNRGLFHDRLQVVLTRARREQSQFALLYLDLNNFKQVNDTLGHAVGDLLLQEIARRLRCCVRESDTVARMGGDEFVLLLGNIQRAEDASLVVEKIHRSLDQPLEVDGHVMSARMSIGIALYPENGVDGKQLLKHADEDMYRAKKTLNGASHGLPTSLQLDAESPLVEP
ncbi:MULTISPECIES: diguanylate cyclase [unclassified Pseudomonas]|uniref:diguanylate cyclase domain-containing protein n=1 Tax=unclassified Pseudomonas TaxID=196821 RepID=UPI002AC9CCDA|nr:MULTISPECIES: diguanylate cyclase [unclassified Pseudomonas]MEB0041235.1 diguanylate cyclase [Pseudomonas sp. MH10]MEB0078324.1 diguanylate cyclase [Pseudomonas sp. MH10out]MEB0092285.1 diguanylate cyclase [Pseudomonas sp. CCI4.2]MEB0101778.1 diguanylate cyclase [Pseudomonas sp. CCI3.2]MEB0123362.1 diguanylate cyclase [Pseudomonas sp. CCI1.2]